MTTENEATNNTVTTEQRRFVATVEAEEAHNTFGWFNANGIDVTSAKQMQDFNTACLRLANAVIILARDGAF